MEPLPDPRTWVLTCVERHERSLLAYARRLCGGDLERARDAVQEAFLELCRRTPQELGPDPRAWLFTACRSRSIDHRRKESRMTPLTDPDLQDRPHPGASPDAALLAAERRHGLAELVDQLPARQAEALRLKFQHGLRYDEIAQVLGCPRGTVGWWVHEGLRALRGRAEARELALDGPTGRRDGEEAQA